MSAARLCEPLAWDSEHFGRPIARLWPSRPTRRQIRAAVQWCDREAIDCLYLLAAADHPPTRALAAKHGFALADVRVELERAVPGGGLPVGGRVREHRAADLDALQELAATAHRGTRFYADPRFDDRLCDRLYRRWIARSAAGWADSVLIAERRGDVAGYVTCHGGEGDPAGTIGLLAVSPDHRGRGLGRELLGAALGRLAELGVDTVRVTTQGTNVASLRLYQRAGFLTRDVGLWYHRWRAAAGR